MVGQTQPGNQIKQTLCSITGSYRGTTNVKRLELLFSLKRGKFIKPHKRVGDRVTGEYAYALLPGEYVVIECKYWSREDPPYTVYAQLVSIDGNCRVRYGKSTVIMFEHGDWLLNQPIPQMLKDIYAWLPGYHSLPNPDFNKTYSENEVNQLIRMIENEVKIIEEAEHE